jgi:Ring finger domain
LNTALNQDGDVADNDEEETTTSLETCPICLCAYEENDEISWSHNNACRHLFHRHCIEKWLLNHEGCPCCRGLFLFFVNNDEMIHNSYHHAPSASPRDNSERPNGRQPSSSSSSSSSSPISIVDSSINRRLDESSPSDESNRNLARGMDIFYRYVASRSHEQPSTNLPTEHFASTINRTRISSNHVEEMSLPPTLNETTRASITSAALEENLEESSASTVRHQDEPASSSMTEITTAIECGAGRAAPMLNIEHVNDYSPTDEVVSSVEEGRALHAVESSR